MKRIRKAVAPLFTLHAAVPTVPRWHLERRVVLPSITGPRLVAASFVLLVVFSLAGDLGRWYAGAYGLAVLVLCWPVRLVRK